MLFSEFPIFAAKELAKKLDQGSLVIFPTDTLPAIASLPVNANNIWKVKKRSMEKPLILMDCDVDFIYEFIQRIAWEDAKNLAGKYWPGALTMILPVKSDDYVKCLNPGLDNLGFRVPDCELAKALLSLTGPLATTSANISGLPAANSPKEACDYFPDVPLLGPIPWPLNSGKASTIVKWEQKGSWKILRKGDISLKGINCI